MSQFNEPWKFRTNYIEDTNPNGYAFGETMADLDDAYRSHVVGPRIVACVNALAGVADPAALVASHAEMLALLRKTAHEHSLMDIHPCLCSTCEVIERARRAKGETP